MRDWLRKRLDAYEERHERRDEEFAALISRSVDALAEKSILHVYIAILAGLNILIWLSVVIFPQDVQAAWERINELNSKIPAVMIVIIFGLGFWLTYSLFRLRLPDLEDLKFQKTVFASFHYSQRAAKRWRIWLFSTVGGIVNVLLLMITEIYLSHGY